MQVVATIKQIKKLLFNLLLIEILNIRSIFLIEEHKLTINSAKSFVQAVISCYKN